ncbi:hypothetical protein [Hymenobacter lapidiphilus]|uniref:Uncharacterized protein n=1 Tax=Hymenobacter lapidiphilus TaxID=2608003 RepID=A0A7Y7PRB3_9BACT|nr:hypothetical protein [Hymenobacter lapidiphilus]NVO32604.1 hypothetical protein [Hymenobacter lapidiphilus]
MKKILFLLPLLGFLIFSGCKKINELLTFEISDSQNIKIPASGLVTPPFVSPIAVPVRSEENFKNNNTRADLVKDVSLTKLTLTITDPAAENFNFLRSIKISIGTDQNDKVPLASLDDVPMGVSSIELKSSNTKLDKYLKAQSYTLYTEVTLRGNVARELTLRSDSKFKVTADPL